MKFISCALSSWFYRITLFLIMKKNLSQLSVMIIISIVILWGLTLTIFFDDWSILMSVLRIVFGSVWLLFLPWWWITQVVFLSKEIDMLERFALSFAFSISVVPLLVFYLNLAWFKITEWLVLWVVLGIVFVSIFILFFRNKQNLWS